MTILKRVTLSLAIAPLVVSIAFATDANDPIGSVDIVKKPKELQVNLQQPAITQETRVIKQQTIRPLTQVNPTKLSTEPERYPEHYQIVSKCYQQQNGNDIVAVKVDKDCVDIFPTESTS